MAEKLPPFCPLCSRSVGGFYLFSGKPGQPDYQACSTACLDAIAALSQETGAMIMKTQMEREAIFQARRPLYDKLVEIGPWVADVFAALTAEQIDGIIETVWDAVRASMQLQSAQGEVPFDVSPPPFVVAPQAIPPPSDSTAMSSGPTATIAAFPFNSAPSAQIAAGPENPLGEHPPGPPPDPQRPFPNDPVNDLWRG